MSLLRKIKKQITDRRIGGPECYLLLIRDFLNIYKTLVEKFHVDILAVYSFSYNGLFKKGEK